MIGFENFSVSAWFENGLTRHVAAPKVKGGSRVATIFAAAVMSAGLAGVVPVAVASGAPVGVGGIATTTIKPSAAPDVPVGYWPNLMKEMKSWESLAEPDIEYPDEG